MERLFKVLVKKIYIRGCRPAEVLAQDEVTQFEEAWKNKHRPFLRHCVHQEFEIVVRWEVAEAARRQYALMHPEIAQAPFNTAGRMPTGPVQTAIDDSNIAEDNRDARNLVSDAATPQLVPSEEFRALNQGLLWQIIRSYNC